MPTIPHVNDEQQADYMVFFDVSCERWIIRARGRNTGEVRAVELQFECPIRSRGRVMFCRAELIVNGVTNHCTVSADVNVALLRTIVVHDQVVQALAIPARGALEVPG